MSSNPSHQDVETQPQGTMRALVSDGNKSASIQSIPVPQPQENEILIRVHSIAQNPTDWKSMKGSPAGRIIGCDFAGTVVDANGSKWRQGQRVAGFVHGTTVNPTRGAFAEYVVTEASLVFAIPDQTTDEQAAVIPLAFATAAQAMFQRLGLPEPSKPSKSPEPFLVNGGTGSVGKYAIQLAKAAGLFVVATGSKAHHGLLKELGADACVDYRDEGWEQQIRDVTHDRLEFVFDSISANGTQARLAECLNPTKGGHIVCLIPPSDEVRAKIDRKVKVESTIVYTVFERAITYGSYENCGEATPADKAFWEKYLSLLPEWLASGTIKPNRQDVRGGLDDILEGFSQHEQGKVSAQKIVYKIVS